MNLDTSHTVEVLSHIKKRWSPREFDPKRKISNEDLSLLFEAARWTPSAYNEQPWNFIVVTKDDQIDFDRMINVLMDGNKAWASQASALVLTVASLDLAHNGSKNFHALYDLGASVANLTMLATGLNIFVHQMGGFIHNKAKAIFKLPENYTPVSILALGYLPTNENFEERKKELLIKRKRKPLNEFVFKNSWNNPFFSMTEFQNN